LHHLDFCQFASHEIVIVEDLFSTFILQIVAGCIWLLIPDFISNHGS